MLVWTTSVAVCCVDHPNPGQLEGLAKCAIYWESWGGTKVGQFLQVSQGHTSRSFSQGQSCMHKCAIFGVALGGAKVGQFLKGAVLNVETGCKARPLRGSRT